MFRVTRWARGGAVAAMAIAATAAGAFAVGTPTRTAEAAQCFERYVPPPVDERGIQCPGDPAVWKSYTFASNNFGYYTETEDLGDGDTIVKLGYRHQDGRIAISVLACTEDDGCQELEWNGVDFPFGH